MIRYFAILLLLTAASSVTAQNFPVEDLAVDDRLPYDFEPHFVGVMPVFADRFWANNVLLHDLNGDGYPERFRAGNPGIVCDDLNPNGQMGNVWWYNVPTGFIDRVPCASLEGIWDVTGDGTLEIVLTMRTEDGFRWRIERLRAETGERIGFYELRGGAEVREDGVWDGLYKVIGCIDAHMPDGVRRVLVVACTAGHDEQPRGMLALDVHTGETVWEYFIGPKPVVHSFHVTDLDADGRMEICFAGVAVNNLDGVKFNGVSDDRPGVFVLNDDGTLAWSHLGAPGTGSFQLDLADADGDGRQELYVARNLERTNDNELMVLDADGGVLQRILVGSGVRDQYIHVGEDRSVRIYLSMNGARLLRFVHAGDRLDYVDGLRFPHRFVRIGAVADVIPGGDAEIIVADNARNLWLLDDELRPLAATRLPYESLPPGRVRLWNAEPESPVLILETSNEKHRTAFRLVPTPARFPFVQVGALVFLAGGGATVWWSRRRRTPPGNVREHRLQLLGRLKLASHGKIGALSALRRLIWLNETRSQGFELSGEPRELYRRLGSELIDTGLPGLFDALDLAGMAELDEEMVERTRRTLEDLDDSLRGLAEASYEEDAVAAMAEELGDAATAAEAAFQSLRRAIEDSFLADPREILERSLAAHDETVRSGGVTVQLPDGAAPVCRVDAEEMTFVLDNLVENALRAMAKSPAPRLSIQWEVEEDEVTVRVTDTGCGIIPDDWSRIFEPGFSQRKGGGLGLPRSREIMTKYGGSLTVRESSPGSGTTFQLRCPAAGD